MSAPRRTATQVSLIAMALWFSCTASAEDNWPQFRGPKAAGVSENPGLPDAWNAAENVVWKTPVPGRGWSSPIVWGEKVFVTTASKEGGEIEPVKKGLYFGGNRPAPKEVHRWVVYCLDFRSGKILWEKEVHRGIPQHGHHLKNTLASETPVTDGERVYAYFGNVGLFCFDFDGNPLWSKRWKSVFTRFGWGTAASPVLHGDRIYVVNDNDEKSFLVALDKKTGEQIWQVDRDEKSNWATPFIWENGKRTEIVTPGTGKIRSYGLDGTPLWELGGMSMITVPTPLAAHGLLYITSGYVMDRQKPLFAVRPGAEGDISLEADQTHNEYVAWCQKKAGPYNPSPIVYGDYLYVLYDMGLLACYHAKTGEEVYGKRRIGPGARAFSASPWAYDGKLFLLTEEGDTFVIRAGPQFELLGKNSLGELCMATPAIVGDSLIIRSESNVLRIRKSPAAEQQSTAETAHKKTAVGVARVDVTPDYPVRLSGFGFRRQESEGVAQRIWAKALAIGNDRENPVVLVAVDNLAVPDNMVREVAARLKKARIGPHRIAVTSTHTHTAPMLTGVAPTLFGQPIPQSHQDHIDRYTRELTGHIEQVALAALADRRPATMAWAIGKVGVAANRRTKGGPVDHDLPMLVVKDPAGKIRAVYVSYACHCVTLSNNKIGGDWAGYAQQQIQEDHPDAIALVSIGCGADSNPRSGVTGDRIDVARQQGVEIAREVDRLLGGDLVPLAGVPAVHYRRIELPFDELPTRTEWQQRAKRDDAAGYHARVNLARLDRGEPLPTKLSYPIQTWTFGKELAMVFLPGEVVVDYSLRLKRESDRRRLWVNAYSNDVPCYIPSERILEEGGYEGGGAMVYFDRPTRLKPGVEKQIVDVVREQLGAEF